MYTRHTYNIILCMFYYIKGPFEKKKLSNLTIFIISMKFVLVVLSLLYNFNVLHFEFSWVYYNNDLIN